jgi:DnaJ-class molecular chaperone
MQPRRDAYLILQVDPSAHSDVIQAAYRVLARQLHPDGAELLGTANHGKMTDLNWAYSVLKDANLRAEYDKERRTGVVRSQPPIVGAPPAPASPAGSGAGAGSASATLDFGRYSGWRLRDVARRDPDYLRWLSRHSSGAPHREEIKALLYAVDHRPKS